MGRGWVQFVGLIGAGKPNTVTDLFINFAVIVS
jgi:hypothetical protein